MYISSMGKEAFSFFGGGGDFLVLLGGREVGPVVTNGVSGGGGCLPMREIIRILQSHRRVAGRTKCSHPTHPPPAQMINNKRKRENKILY